MTAPSDPKDRCTATSKQGRPCKNPVVPGTTAAGKRGFDPEPHGCVGLDDTLMDVFRQWPLRFSSKVTVSDGCWNWTACRDALGYGRFSMGRGPNGHTRVYNAHRIGLILLGMDVPADMVVDHLCRNPGCVRPDHLEVVERGENVRRGAQQNNTGVCRAGLHPWTPENIVTEPSRPGQPAGVRRCRGCRDERERQRVRSVA